MQSWKKLGLVFSPKGNYDWMVSYASNPVAVHLSLDIFRIFFSCRDKNNRSSIGCLDIDLSNPGKAINLSQKPILTPGQLGEFDDSGVTLACIIEDEKKRKYLYYIGWNLGVTVPFRNSIGLAVDMGNGFQKTSRAPVMDRNEVDPYSMSYPWVIKDDSLWKMWYGSNPSWGKEKPEMSHVIKYAESKDGVIWDRKGIVCINPENPLENSFSRPCVIKEAGSYKMWYSYRSSKKSQEYRIGYAESVNGKNWVRKDDEVGLDVSAEGWDTEMVCYPTIFNHKGKRYMLYNGNHYGQTGFGLAILEE
jgi:hypothetical protein